MNISKDTIARTICLGLALINQLLAIYGKHNLVAMFGIACGIDGIVVV